MTIAAIIKTEEDVRKRMSRAWIEREFGADEITEPPPFVCDEAGRERRIVTESVMKMLDLFERGDIDPTARAAFVVERFDHGIVDNLSDRFSVRRVRRAIEAMIIVFREITTDL
jgi:hypothetical protein